MGVGTDVLTVCGWAEQQAMAGRPVVCVSFAVEHPELCYIGRIQCAYIGLEVVGSPWVDDEQSCGRVCSGVGVVTNPDSGLGNISVWWKDDSDLTTWTRAADHGFDVLTHTVTSLAGQSG